MIVVLDFETPSFLLRCHPEQREGSPACLEGGGRCFTYVQHDRYRLHPSVFWEGMRRAAFMLHSPFTDGFPFVSRCQRAMDWGCARNRCPQGRGQPCLRWVSFSGCRKASFPGVGMYPFRVSECILSGCRNVSFPGAGMYPFRMPEFIRRCLARCRRHPHCRR